MNPLSFLDLLWSNKPEDLRIQIWTLQDRRSRCCRHVGEAAHAVEGCSGMDVYVGVGLSPEDFGPHQRCPAKKIAGIAGLWADIDIQSDAHAKKALPATATDALTVIPAEMPPTITVATGNGIHAWWLLKEPLIFDTAEERDRTAAIIYRWQSMLRYNAASRGWAFDRLADLSRVLRIPGTYNFKDPAAPKPVLVHSLNDRRYNLSDFEDYLDDVGVPGQEAQPMCIAAGSADAAANTGFVLNLNAEIPGEVIRRWTEIDSRFRDTWFRHRHDLKDQSQSGYDMALAAFGMDAGLAPQQTVDLIVQHRRLHNQKPRTRVDYFQRTLGRASSRPGVAPAILVTGQPPVEAEVPGTTQTENEGATEPGRDEADRPIDPMAAKAALCEAISARLGIRILRILKITGAQPTYQIELEQGRIELPSVAKLIDQRSLRLAIASTANKIIAPINPRDWAQVARAMLEALIEIEGGVEAEFEGSMRAALGHYLNETAFIPGIDGQPPHAIQRPMIIGDQIAVNSVDLQLYLNKTFGRNVSVKSIVSMLSAIGAQSIRVRGTKIREQGRWLLPIDQFPPADFTAQAPEHDGGSDHGR